MLTAPEYAHKYTITSAERHVERDRKEDKDSYRHSSRQRGRQAAAGRTHLLISRVELQFLEVLIRTTWKQDTKKVI